MKYDTNKERTARRRDRANVNQIAAASRQCSREGERRLERKRGREVEVERQAANASKAA